MTYVPKKGGSSEVVLASAVADDATFEMPYPTGYTQASFNAGLEKYGSSYVMLNDMDKLAQADPGVSISYGASVITVTNLSGASIPAGTKVRGWFEQRNRQSVLMLAFPVSLDTVTAADVVTNFRPGVSGYIENISWVTDVAPSASDAATFNLEIGTTNVTGGVIELTSAAAGAKGTVVEGTQITANNRVLPESLVAIEAADVTDYASGSGTLYVRIGLDDL